MGPLMGLFGAYLIYRHGRKKARRSARREIDELQDRLDELEAEADSSDDDVDDELVCDLCGHRLAQHSDDDPPLCPNY